MKRLIAGTQQLGRALMLPIAVLPIAGLLLRLGQPDLLDIPSIAAAGNAIFSNLGLIFAIGVAVGFARENHGAAGLAAVVGFLVATKGAEVLIQVPPAVLGDAMGSARDLAAAAYKSQELAKLSVPVGIISGLIAGLTYNRYSDIRLPSYLAFFAGRRFIPIATGTIGLLVAGAFGLGWPYLERGMDSLSRLVLDSGNAGLFAYGVLNRTLIVTGLHHIINNLAWFLLGDYHGVTGDLKRFFAGDPTAGEFMSGFFPVMMFGLPAACLAMFHSASPERRRATGGLLLSMALTSFLTGVTEPIEFTFMFLAPMLYGVHALLTGAAMVVMKVLGVHLGFSFSAGLFDYLLNFNRATRPLWLLPVGLGYFAAYYGLFRFFIVRFNLATPGRERETSAEASLPVPTRGSALAAAYITALGGAANLQNVDACTTRLRLQIADRNAVDGDALKRLGASGTVQLSAQALQVVVGPVADQLAGDIRAELQRSPATAAAAVPDAVHREFVARLLAALGGRDNLATIEPVPGRLLVQVVDAALVQQAALAQLVVRGVAHPEERWWQLLLGDAAAAVAAGLGHPQA
jgi:PTS system N-acetylglucosamine-specific IIC component